MFLRRAQNWRNVMHNGYPVPRSAGGTFEAGFSPDGCVDDAFIEGSGGQYAFMGNEVSLKTPWIYTFAGAPWKTQALVRRVISRQ